MIKVQKRFRKKWQKTKTIEGLGKLKKGQGISIKTKVRMGNSVLCYDVQMGGMGSEQEQRKEIDSLDFRCWRTFIFRILWTAKRTRHTKQLLSGSQDHKTETAILWHNRRDDASMQKMIMLEQVIEGKEKANSTWRAWKQYWKAQKWTCKDGAI